MQKLIEVWTGNHRDMLRELLARRTGEDPARLRIERGPGGKPYLPDFPDLHFNLSRSGALWAVALSMDAPVGVDIESVRDLPHADEIRHRYGLPDGPLLFEWTRRQAYLKARGISGASGPDSFDPGWHVESFIPMPGYVGAWCAEGAAAHAFYRRWS